MQSTERVWHKAWPEDVPKDFEVAASIGDLLRQTAAANPQQTAISFYGNDLSYALVDETIDRLANALIGLGLAKGDRAGIFLQNSPQFVMGYFGILRAGGVVVCLNPMFKQAELEYEITDAGCRMLLTSDNLYPEIAKLPGKAGLENIIVTWLGEYCPSHQGFEPPPEVTRKSPPQDGTLDLQELLARASAQPPGIALDLRQDLALLQYTGGTTGLPKGAMITHHALASSVLGSNYWFAHTGQDVCLGATPFFHIMGMTVGMCGTLLAGARLVILARFIPEHVAQAISHYKVTAWVGATTMLVALLNMPGLERYDFGSFRYVCTGGAPIGVELQRRMLELAPQALIMEGYGLTESVSQGGAVTPRGRYKPGFVGVPHLSDMKIVDPGDPDKVLPANQEGEIAIKGPATFAGYWQRPEETATVLRDGWVHTGDMGLLDEEGYLKLLGRQRELIKCSGFSVFPAEVEDLLYRHPAVGEVAVIGVPDSYRGESPKAFVIVKPGFQGQVSEEDILAWAKENMAAYKRPREVVFCGELPKSGAGKLLRRVLKEREESA
ncbi:MAG: AMP-binding protein [Pseudomonadota bacterium]